MFVCREKCSRPRCDAQWLKCQCRGTRKNLLKRLTIYLQFCMIIYKLAQIQLISAEQRRGPLAGRAFKLYAHWHTHFYLGSCLQRLEQGLVIMMMSNDNDGEWPGKVSGPRSRMIVAVCICHANTNKSHPCLISTLSSLPSSGGPSIDFLSISCQIAGAWKTNNYLPKVCKIRKCLL